MNPLKDWSQQIADLETMDKDAVLALYSDMLATAHDIGYKVPDDQLIETEDPERLRAVVPALHEGIVKAHAEAKKNKRPEFAPTTSSAHTLKASELKGGKAKAKPTAKAPKKPAKSAVQKEPNVESKTMATATTKKAAKKAPAKKAAKAPPAKKAGKKAASANARTAAGASRNPFGENAVIKVLNKEHGANPDSERGKRIAVVLKYNGKKVSDFYAKEKAPFNRTDTLRFMIDRKIISIK